MIIYTLPYYFRKLLHDRHHNKNCTKCKCASFYPNPQFWSAGRDQRVQYVREVVVVYYQGRNQRTSILHMGLRARQQFVMSYLMLVILYKLQLCYNIYDFNDHNFSEVKLTPAPSFPGVFLLFSSPCGRMRTHSRHEIAQYLFSSLYLIITIVIVITK